MVVIMRPHNNRVNLTVRPVTGLANGARPAPLLRQYVDAGWLGRKTKRGFHKY